MKKHKIAIIGSGVSGLVAGISLKNKGYSFDIYESTDRVGGRVKTDYRDGYKFDHGFQVLLTAYPAAKKYLNYDLLDLMYFKPGAKIYKNGNAQTIGDPLRDLSLLFPTLFAKVGNFSDKLKVLKLRKAIASKSIDSIFRAPEISTLDYLRNYGFSEEMIEQFFKPFFTGIFLEHELKTSSRKFEFVYKMFTEGYAAVPKKGIQAISNQLAAQLDKTAFQFNTRIKKVDNQTLIFEDDQQKSYDYVIIATDAAKLITNLNNQEVEWKSVENLYFTTKSKVSSNIISLIAHSEALVNNFHLEHFEHKSIVSVSVVKPHQLEKAELIDRVKTDLKTYANIQLDECVKHFTIKKALPIMQSVNYMLPKSETQLKDTLFLAGDHLANGSLNAAMLNGESAAQAIIEKIEKGIINVGLS